MFVISSCSRSKKNIIWKFKTDGYVGTLIVADGIIYFGSADEYFYALDIKTGKERWKIYAKDNLNRYAISEGVVYLTAYEDGEYLCAIDAKTGKTKWKLKTDIWTMPIISNNIIIWGDFDGFLTVYNIKTNQVKRILKCGKNFNSISELSDEIICSYVDEYLCTIDLLTGRIKWKFNLGDFWGTATPFIYQRTVFFGSAYSPLYAFDLMTGKKKWESGEISRVCSTPTVSDGLIFVGSEDGNFYALDLINGHEKWKFKLKNDNWPKGSPVVLKNTVYFGGFGFLYAKDIKTGKEKWKFKVGGSVEYLTISDGIIYLTGGEDNHIYAVQL